MILKAANAAVPKRAPRARGVHQHSYKLALPEWPAISLSTQILAWIPIQKQDLASAMGIMRRALDIDQCMLLGSVTFFI